jgi:hypothetical protein
MKKTTHRHKHNCPIRSIITVLATVAGFLSAHAENTPVETANGQKVIIYDSDGDGWHDLWCAIHRDLKHRDKKVDTDGDGLTDYEEMLLWRDPFVKGPLPRKPTPEEIAESKRNAEEAAKRRVIAIAERREQLAPFIVAPLAKKDGSAASTEAVAAERKTAVAAFATRLTSETQEGRQQADALARQLGINTKFILPDGRVGALTEAPEGIPDFNVTYNAVAADTISTDEVQSGGSSELSLSGSGQTIGIWDGGDVLTTHTEFTLGGVRVFDKDGASPLGVQHHPTHVAGTMIAKGVNGLAEGMSPSGTLDAYDFDSDFAEMATAVATTPVRVSNHSYGLQRGWGILPVGGQNYLAWWGNTSISINEDFRYGYYDNFARTADSIGYAEPDYLSVWAAGNERGGSGIPGANPANGYYAWDGSAWQVSFLVRPDDFANDAGFDLLEGRGVAKNVLTISAVEDIVGGYTGPSGVVISSFSSLGPPDDGRVKPDLAANGVQVFSTTSNGSYLNESGTSMAAPTVTGSLALLREHWSNLFDTAPLRAASLKALAIHTADEAGGFGGPDYQFGWGLMNTETAAELITKHEQSGDALRHVKQTVLSDGDYVEFTVRAIGGQPLRVTAVWTDPPGALPPAAVDVDTDATRALVNDLDLRLIDSVITHYPWKLDPANPMSAATRSGDNKRDNVEQVLVDSPTAGQEFTVRVTHKGTLKDDTGTTAPQELSLVLSGIVADPAPELKVLDISATGVDQYTVSWASVVGATYQIETLTDLTTGSWTTLSGDYVATKETTAAEITNNPGETRRFWRVKRQP